MRPRLLITAILVFVVAALLPTAASAQWLPDIKPTVENAAAPAAAPAVEVQKADPERLGFIQRRKLGLTVANIKPIVKKLKSEGRWTGDPAVDSVTVAEQLNKQAPKEYAALEAIDWDRVIAFIEKILPLILKLIDLFG